MAAETPRRKRDPEGVKRNILAVAHAEFAAKGLSGARIEDIAERTNTSKRMIYYYFGDKEGLYLRVLEAAYRTVRAGEAELPLDTLPPIEALERLVSYTFDHHAQNPEFVRLVMIENIHNAAFIARSEVIRQTNKPGIDRLDALLARGVAAGVFRPGITALDLHWKISALSFYNVSNRATFASQYGAEVNTPEGQDRLRAGVCDMVLGAVLTPQAWAAR
ncbi:TetR/AcrR family transcriptional regulator [Tropicibacter naphthalenivorans]|uniref:Nicotinate degradation protein S n=1 Tax=Tropicibacter naphthalenivorans TaxID=441103 RepID=A0A0P1GDM1_9RHOB|nr:TetR/AcrR family transcriptional regulator [Tropicibacter naphthalenivorans]CUH79485.1 Nicotinate degradation protein S [Tropicibacter naphthalenivorans]SMC73054.1 transcriptional regulator, TetR family [Tropicibacter naphthalenivorans]